MLIYSSTILWILSNIIGVQTDSYSTTLELANGSVSFTFDMYVEFSLAWNDQSTYETEHIEKFSFNAARSELNIKYGHRGPHNWLKLDCDFSEYDTFVTIGGCAIDIQTSETNEIYSLVIGHKFLLRKNTKYHFAQHSINFKINQIGSQFFGFVITSLIIDFDDTTKTCALTNHDVAYHKSTFNKLNLVTLCTAKSQRIHFQPYTFDRDNQNFEIDQVEEKKPEVVVEKKEEAEEEKKEETAEDKKEKAVEEKSEEANEEKKDDDLEEKDKEGAEENEKEEEIDIINDTLQTGSWSAKDSVTLLIAIILFIVSLGIIGFYMFKKGLIPAKFRKPTIFI